MPRPTLLLLGDSITEFGTNIDLHGWVLLLLQRYNRSATIHQNGLSAYNTKAYMEYVFAKLKHDLSTTLSPALITLCLGANDAALLDGENYSQHVPIDDYKRNLHALVAMFKETAPHANILLITPPPVNDEERKKRSSDGKLDRSNAAAGEYARALVAVAKEANVTSLDTYTYFNGFPLAERNACLVDGLHLSAKGHALFEQLLVDTIEKTFPDLHKALNQQEYPPYRDLYVSTSGNNLDKSPGQLELKTALRPQPDSPRHSVESDQVKDSFLYASISFVLIIIVAGFLLWWWKRRRPQLAPPEVQNPHSNFVTLE